MSDSKFFSSFPPWAVRLIMGMIVRKLQMRQDHEAKILIDFLRGFYKDSSLVLLDCWASSVLNCPLPSKVDLDEAQVLCEDEIYNSIIKRLTTIHKKAEI